MNNTNQTLQAPSKAFRISALAALCIGVVSYMIGLFNADMVLNEKGYYLIVILYGLFASVSVQKSVRDKAEGVKTSGVYYLLAWIATGSALILLCIGLYNANLMLSEKGFFGMAYVLSLFSAITVQKNVRDVQAIKENATTSEWKIESSNKRTETETVADAF